MCCHHAQHLLRSILTTPRAKDACPVPFTRYFGLIAYIKSLRFALFRYEEALGGPWLHFASLRFASLRTNVTAFLCFASLRFASLRAAEGGPESPSIRPMTTAFQLFQELSMIPRAFRQNLRASDLSFNKKTCGGPKGRFNSASLLCFASP